MWKIETISERYVIIDARFPKDFRHWRKKCNFTSKIHVEFSLDNWPDAPY